MAELLEYLPLFQEDATSIRARLDADVNAGLDPSDPRWIDTREGTFYYDITQVMVMEFARMWDALAVEVPAAAFPLFAWGDYLDYHAAVFDLERKDAVQASGEVSFVGDPGTIIGTGTVVSSDPASEDDDAVEFETTESGTIGAQIAAPSGLAAITSTAGGTLATGTYYYVVTALNEFGETLASAEVAAAVSGPTGSVALDWDDVAGAIGYRVYRANGTGEQEDYYEAAASEFTDTGAAATTSTGPPASNLTGGVTLAVRAVDAGVEGNVGARAVTTLDTPNTGVDQVFNAAAMIGGEEVEGDDGLRERILFEFEGQGAGNENDYRRWALSRPGVGRVTVVPTWNGAGTVLVVVMQANGDPVPTAVVDDVQEYLDPLSGTADGKAPVGVTVTVQTAATQLIDVAATLTFVAGYSLDGSGGTIATRSAIEKALSDYIDGLDVGDDVIYNHVLAQFFRVTGVFNVSNVTVNGGTSNIAVPTSPATVAQLDDVNLA